MSRILLVVAALLTTACATTTQQPRQALVSPNDVICTRETPTGSRVAVRVCRSRAEVEQREIEDRQMLREMRSEANRNTIE